MKRSYRDKNPQQVERERKRAGEEGGKHSRISSAVRLLERVLESSGGCNDCTRVKLGARAILDYYPLSPITYRACCNFLVSHDTDLEREKFSSFSSLRRSPLFSSL